MEDKIFFLDNFKGVSEGGIFIRNDLGKQVAKMERTGLKVVGIKVDDSWNVELLTELKDFKQKLKAIKKLKKELDNEVS